LYVSKKINHSYYNRLIIYFSVRGLGIGRGNNNPVKRKAEQQLIQPVTKANSSDDAVSVCSINSSIDDTIFDTLR